MIDRREWVDHVAAGETRVTGPGTVADRPVQTGPSHDGQNTFFSNPLPSVGNAFRHRSMCQVSYINCLLHDSRRGGEDTRVAFLSAMKSRFRSNFESSRIAAKPAAFCAKMIKDRGTGG